MEGVTGITGAGVGGATGMTGAGVGSAVGGTTGEVVAASTGAGVEGAAGGSVGAGAVPSGTARRENPRKSTKGERRRTAESSCSVMWEQKVDERTSLSWNTRMCCDQASIETKHVLQEHNRPVLLGVLAKPAG